jgi:hypothetical protein
MQDYKKKLVEMSDIKIPLGFVAIGPVDHPGTNNRHRQESGMLIRNRQTGIYGLLTLGGSVRSVPHKWAQDAAAEMGKGSDAIQDQCIARMEALKLNPNQVAEMLDGKVSRSHVCDYLTRRSSIGSHKLQHLFDALKMSVNAKD